MNESWQQLIEDLINSGYLKTPRIIDAFKTIDRKDFVLPEYIDEAYGNHPLPIGERQTISQPLTVALMLELLDPQPGEKILDVGSGSGWVSALLAYLVSKPQTNADRTQKYAENENVGNGYVVGMERIQKLCELGRNNLKKYFQEDRAKIFCDNATSIIPEEGPFDKIISGAAASRDIPEIWRNALKVNGRIVAPIDGSIWRFTKKAETEWQEEEFPGFTFVPLVSNHHKQKNEESRYLPPISIVRTIDTDKNEVRHSWLPVILLVPTLLMSYTAHLLVAPLTFMRPKIDIEIREGFGIRQIGELLKEKKLIRSKWLFVLWAGFSGKHDELQYGRYQFENNATIPEIVERLRKGERFPNEQIITIPEGWSLEDIAGYLENQGIVSKENFYSVVGRPYVLTRESEMQKKLYEKFAFLSERPAGANLEGYLFPDTYRVFRSSAPEDILLKMLENFAKKITTELAAEIKKQDKTIFEIITIASLIEKEVVSSEDRSIVSGILWKRIELGIGLQVDATIAYITGKRTTKISSEELAIGSPYNTYKYRGLPPGPISNPGISAIRAAIFPKPSPYLYYLSSTDGKTVFSKTLEEHNEAKVKYLK